MDGDSRYIQEDLCRAEVRERLVSRLLVRAKVPEEEKSGVHKQREGWGHREGACRGCGRM